MYVWPPAGAYASTRLGLKELSINDKPIVLVVVVVAIALVVVSQTSDHG